VDLVITLCSRTSRREICGYYGGSVAGFTTDQERARAFHDLDVACATLETLQIRFRRLAALLNVRSRGDAD
jgi:hypothetical protein